VQGRAYLATGLHNDAVNRVTLNLYGFDSIGSTTSIVQNNTVSNVSGAGIAVNELSNPVLSNSVYSTTTPYEPWKPYRFDASNTIIS
jgi:parallel beta-helix repeat protein